MSECDTGCHQPFATTHWSLVGRAGRGIGDAQRLALNELVAKYTPALRAHLVVKKKMDADRAGDMVQGFLTDKVVERHFVAEADRGRGRFRTFLSTALDRYVIDVTRRENAKKRSPGSAGTMSIDDNLDCEERTPSPGRAFDIAWARQVIGSAVDQMRAECDRTGRPDIWGVFDARVLASTLYGAEPTPYDELVERFGFDSPAQASNVAITAKRMFKRSLRSVVGEYSKAEQVIDEEIADLTRILSSGGAG